MFSTWRDAWYFLAGALVGALIAVLEFGPPLRDCRTALGNPEHCAAYCNDAWRDYYGC